MLKRINWIDIARCFGIFAIYIGHFGSLAGNAYTFVFTHHVVLFFVISGCAEHFSSENNLLKFLLKLLKGLLIPWFLFSILSILIRVFLYNEQLSSVVSFLKTVAFGTIRNTFFASSLWFLTCLAVIRILFFFIKKVKLKPLIFCICLGVFLIAEYILEPHPVAQPSLPFNIDNALYYILFYAIGYCAFPCINTALNPKTCRGKILLAASILLSFFYAGLLYFGKDLLAYIPLGSTVSSIIRPLIIIWLYFVLAQMCQGISIFQEIGQNTLFLCGNEFVIRIVSSSLLAAFGLSAGFSTPLEVFIHVAILLVVSTKTLVPIEKKLLSAIYKLPKYFFKKQAKDTP